MQYVEVEGEFVKEQLVILVQGFLDTNLIELFAGF